jgi:hypothetical protein
MRAVALIADHSLPVIMVPSRCRMALSMGGRDGFEPEMGTSGSFLQSSRLRKISRGYS